MTYEERCVVCNDLVHSYEYPNDYYELRSYAHHTYKPYKEKRINIYGDTEEIMICNECSKTPLAKKTIKEIMKQKRLEWYDDKISSKERDIVRAIKEIKQLQLSIPRTKKEIIALKAKRKKVK